MHVCAADGDLRLVGGASESPGTASAAEYGRLQIFSSGGWGVVCDDELQQDYSGFADVVDARFTEAAVGVACRQLGFTSGEKVILAVRTPLARPRSPRAICITDCTAIQPFVSSPFTMQQAAVTRAWKRRTARSYMGKVTGTLELR